MRVANYILASRSSQLPTRKLDTAITVLMLLPSGPDVRLGYAGLQERRYRIDSSLIVMLLDSVRDPETQRAIVHSPAFACLPPHLFRRLFFRLWPARRGNAWRWTLGRTLSSFLHENPGEAHFYAKAIWTIANAPDESVALAGLASTRYLGKSLSTQGAERLVELSHDPSDRSMAALSILSDLYKNIDSLTPEAQRYLLDPATMANLRTASPSDGRGPLSAYRLCMKNLRNAINDLRQNRRSHAGTTKEKDH